MKRYFYVPLILLIFASACITQQDKIGGNITTTPNNTTGTKSINYCGENNTNTACKENFSESKFIKPKLGLLKVSESWYESETRQKNLSYITWVQYHPGPIIIGWYILDNGTEIRTWEDFKRFFSPVDNEEESIAFAVAKANYSRPIYKEEDFFKGEVLVASNVTLTHAEKTSDGYLVNMFEDGGYCYPHSEEIRYLVKENGDIERFDARSIYKMNETIPMEERCVY
ncbi:MAG: hypothetical protein HY362_04930 [Candidatus Aenigmarchaeota archaeon]|nr:hypothetical protein [Candidatus Aenigmarchaeota archaeon]